MGAVPADPEPATIAFLIDRWEPARGGAERALCAFAAHLERRGLRVLAVAERHAPDAPGIPVVTRSFGLTRSGLERRRARALVEAAREAGAQLTIGCRHLYECDLYWPHGGVHAATLAQRDRARGIAPGPMSGRHAQFVAFERALVDGGARKIVCVSELVRAEFLEHWPTSAKRLVVIENGIDLERFSAARRVSVGAELRRKLQAGSRTCVVAFIGRNPELKGLPTLLAALESLASAGERDWLVAATDGEPTGASAAVRERWRSCGETDVADLLAAADVLAHPTWRDTSGLVILEALASGVPVVTTRAAGACGHVGAGAGIVLDTPGDVPALAQALRDTFAAVRSASIDRERIRTCVAGSSRDTCHARLEALVHELLG